MKKYTLTGWFGLLGAATWILTMFAREAGIGNFIFGIMPNIGATWIFIWLGESILIKKGIEFDLKKASIVASCILIFGIGSEIVHDKFLDSPFDVYDIVATICAIGIYLLIFYYTNLKNKVQVIEK